MSQPEQQPKPLLEKLLDTGFVAGVFGIIIGVATKAASILHPAIGLTVGSYIGKKVFSYYRVTSSVVERFPDKKEVYGSIP